VTFVGLWIVDKMLGAVIWVMEVVVMLVGTVDAEIEEWEEIEDGMD